MLNPAFVHAHDNHILLHKCNYPHGNHIPHDNYIHALLAYICKSHYDKLENALSVSGDGIEVDVAEEGGREASVVKAPIDVPRHGNHNHILALLAEFLLALILVLHYTPSSSPFNDFSSS